MFPALWLQLGEKAISWAQVCCYLGARAAGLLPSPLMGALLAPGDPLQAQPRQQRSSAQLRLLSQGTSSSAPLPHPSPASLPGHRLQAPTPPAGGAAGPQCRPPERALALLSRVAELGVLMLDGAKQRDPKRTPKGAGCWHRAGRSVLTGAQEG